MDAVLSCMVTDNLGPGSLSDQLTSAVGGYLGIAGGIALRERSRAFAMAIDGLSLTAGHGVVLDPLLPYSYHEALRERGLVPLCADVLDSSLCIDPEAAERVMTRFTEAGGVVGALIAHTTLGYVPDMQALGALAVPIIEDVSEGVGSNTGEEQTGRFGRFVVVAMEPDGIVTAGGGSLLLAAGRNDRAALRRAADELPVDALLPDMNAALGLTQIKEIEGFVARRAEIASTFSRAIMRGRHRVPVQPADAQNVHCTFPVLVEGSVPEIVAYSRKKGVEAALAFPGTIIDRAGQAAAASDDTDTTSTPDCDPTNADSWSFYDELPVARGLLLRCVRFPLYPSLTAKETAVIERVLTTLP